MSVASISEKQRLGLGALSATHLSGLLPLNPLARFGFTAPPSPISDTIDRMVPEPVFKLLTNVMGTDLHAHEGGSADRSFLRYTLIKGILKGGITKLVIKPNKSDKPFTILLEDELDENGKVVAHGNVLALKKAFAAREQYSEKAFYKQYIKDEVYLNQQLKKIQESKEILKKTADVFSQEKDALKQSLIKSAEAFHKAQVKLLQGQLDRYALYKENEAWFWTDFLSTDSLKLYFRFYENLENMLSGKVTEGLQDVDDLEDPSTVDQIKTKLAKVSAYQDAVFRWGQGDSAAEKVLQDDFMASRANRLTDYRRTSTIINPAVKKLHVANLNAYNFLNRLAKENIRYAEYRVSLTGNDIGDPTNQTYYYDGQDKLWAVASGLYGAQRNNARWGNPIDYGITVLLERQPNTGRLPKEKQEDLKERPTDSPEEITRKRAEKIQLSLAEAHRVVDLALANKKAAIAINDAKRKNKDTNLDPRERITSIDLAGDEANFPADIFKKAFDKVHQFNEAMLAAGKPQHCLGITIHAGEEPFSSDANKRNYQWSQSIEHALEVGYRGPNDHSNGKPVTPFRIGHGIMLWAAESKDGLLRREYAAYAQNPRKWADAVKNDPERIQRIVKATPLIDKLLNGNVGIELCPKSNVQTGSVPYYTVHPALFFLKMGLKVSVNTDNRTISNTDNANELIKLHRYLGLRWEELKTLIRNGAETAFIPTTEERDQVKADIEKRLTELERDPKKLLGIMLMDGYTPPEYVYKTPNTISPIKKQNVGFYPRIDANSYRDTASRAENQRASAVFDVIKEQTAALKNDKPQPWEANA